MDMDMVQDMAEFPLVSVKEEDAVRYQCQYWVLEPPGTSGKSEPVELVVTGEGTGESRWPWAVPPELCSIPVSSLYSDPRYPPANISLSQRNVWRRGPMSPSSAATRSMGAPSSCTRMGTQPLSSTKNPTIRAQPPSPFLTPADSGTYRCSYHIGSFRRPSSCLGDNVTLEVIARSAHPGAERRPHGNLVVAVVRGCSAALVFGLGLYFVLDARSLWIRRDDSPGWEDS
uniref:Uncharacterized protein n=1 Tax=Chrysolophus pictus TaxID=9089 RepID=A0A8C3PV23_CHRPC